MKKTLCIFLTLIMLLLTACNTAEPIDVPEEVESPSANSEPESFSTPVEESTPVPESPLDSSPEIESTEVEIPSESIHETESAEVESPSESYSAPIEESIPESKKPEDEGDTTEAPNESTNSDSKESTSNEDNWIAPLFSTDYYNEYLDFLSNDKVKVPDNFITYDMIKNIGAFESLVVYSFDDYGYLLFDENDILISVRILSTLNNASTTTITSTYESNDLREITAPNNQESTLFHNGILYNYSKSGGLYRISWQYAEQAVTIAITMGYVHLNEYPLEGETTFVSQLLSLQTAEAAVQSFNQKVEAEIAKNIADKQQKG